jgi:hypothetical protein
MDVADFIARICGADILIVLFETSERQLVVVMD